MWNFIFLICLLLVLFIFFNTRKPKGYPPGPIWLPLVGSYFRVKELHLKNKHLHLAAMALHKIYGPVVGLKLGFSRVVLVAGYDKVKEACRNELLDGRPDGLFFRMRGFGELYGVVFVDGHFREEQKKYTMNLLRKLGLGTSVMHDIIVREAQEFTKIIEANCEKPLKINNLLDIHAVNVIWTLLSGYRFSADDQRLLKLMKLIHRAFEVSEMSGGVINQLPFLKYLAPTWSGYSELAAFIDEIMAFLHEIVENHDPVDKQNFISIYLEKIKEMEGVKDTSFTRKQLLVLLEDLFMAGTETTSNTILFISYHLIQYPEVQKKIHAELDRELGADDIPTFEYRDRLIYLEATIMEVQRLSSLVPITLPHRAVCDTEFSGYNIPKDTILLYNIWSVHMDETYWRDPYKFRPERFIDGEGKLIQTSYFMPFGSGRRKCLGEIPAKASLFIFLAVILKKFELKLPDNHQSIEVKDGMTLSLAPFDIKFIPRKLNSCHKEGP